MSDDLGLDLRADPPEPGRSRADIGCGILLACLFGSVLTCVLGPMQDDSLDRLNVEATKIALRKLAERIDASGVLPSELPGDSTDAWGNPIEYRPTCTDGRGTYALVSLGKDGRPGGEGHNADLRFESTVPLTCS